MLLEPAMRQNLLSLATTYSKHLGTTMRSVANAFCGDIRFLDRIQSGKSFQASQYDKIVCRMAMHWPAGLAWPAKVPRPDKGEISKALGDQTELRTMSAPGTAPKKAVKKAAKKATKKPAVKKPKAKKKPAAKKAPAKRAPKPAADPVAASN